MQAVSALAEISKARLLTWDRAEKMEAGMEGGRAELRGISVARRPALPVGAGEWPRGEGPLGGWGARSKGQQQDEVVASPHPRPSPVRTPGPPERGRLYDDFPFKGRGASSRPGNGGNQQRRWL